MFIVVLQLDEVAASNKFRIEVGSVREKYGCQSLSTEVLIHQEETCRETSFQICTKKNELFVGSFLADIF